MEENGTRNSTVFPPGYGDFALESSDGLICHFPRHLLAYMSDTSRDMFGLPAGEGREGHSEDAQAPLKVTEPGQILELFLQNIDPKHPTPPIDPSTIVHLLEAAQKYQAPTITKWFEEEATLKHESKSPLQISVIGPFTATHPVLTSYCAVRFNLPTTGRLALQEFALCHISCIFPSDNFIDIPSYLEGKMLREERRKYFDALIARLAVPSVGPAWRSAGYMRDTCVDCTGNLAQWIVLMERAVRDEPSWRAFIEACERPEAMCQVTCHRCKTSKWSVYFKDEISKSRVEVKAAESLLPAWPF